MADFQNYADVQAALDAEYLAWKADPGGFKKTQEAQVATEARQWWNNYTPPASSSPAPSPPPPKPPDPWTRSSNYKPPTGIKQADPDIVLFDSEGISPEFLLELQYEDIAGMELINISRSDIIDGQDVVYSPVKNLSSIRRRYNPNNIISLPELSDSFFSRFGIDLLQRGMNDPYFDEEGNLVIEIDNVKDGEVIEVEIDTNGTIEEVEFL